MRITKVELNPLQKIKQLKKLKSCNCMSCDCENNMFTVTFKIGDTGTKELLQDLTSMFLKSIYQTRIRTIMQKMRCKA